MGEVGCVAISADCQLVASGGRDDNKLIVHQLTYFSRETTDDDVVRREYQVLGVANIRLYRFYILGSILYLSYFGSCSLISPTLLKSPHVDI